LDKELKSMTDTDQAAHAKAAQEADKKRQDEARKKVKEDREAREKASKEAPAAVKPTPTQEENDLAASGVHVAEHEPDGSDEQPTGPVTKDSKDKEVRPAPTKAGYATRSAG
jgi:hypothetical protein